MKSQTLKNRVLSVALFLAAVVSAGAQDSSMRMLIDQSLGKLQPSSPETWLDCIAELKQIDALFPDSIPPKYQLALQSLNFAVMNPHDEQAEKLLIEAGQTIDRLESMDGMKDIDMSDVYTLRGFFYMVRIVQDPAQNGKRYYLDVMRNYEKALNLNPDNKLASQLQDRFREGMRQRE